MHELEVEDRDGFVDAASLKGVAGPAVVVYAVLLGQSDGERHHVAQRSHLPSADLISYSEFTFKTWFLALNHDLRMRTSPSSYGSLFLCSFDLTSSLTLWQVALLYAKLYLS